MPLCYLWSLQVTLSIYNIYPELEIAAWPGLSTVSTVFSSPIHLYLYTYLYHFPASVVLILVQHYNCCTICSNITLTQSRRQADKSKESRSNCESVDTLVLLPGHNLQLLFSHIPDKVILYVPPLLYLSGFSIGYHPRPK
jgi:hypothetical protein